jgi:hypothetical protein
MKTNFTKQHIEDLLAAGKIRGYKENIKQPAQDTEPKERKSKYGNNKKEIDGIMFDSTKEANRYCVLKVRLKAGEIGLLEVHKDYILMVEGKRICKYIADFVYVLTKTGERVVEDVKSEATRKAKVYRLKKKMMKEILGIEIIEV